MGSGRPVGKGRGVGLGVALAALATGVGGVVLAAASPALGAGAGLVGLVLVLLGIAGLVVAWWRTAVGAARAGAAARRAGEAGERLLGELADISPHPFVLLELDGAERLVVGLANAPAREHLGATPGEPPDFLGDRVEDLRRALAELDPAALPEALDLGEGGPPLRVAAAPSLPGRLVLVGTDPEWLASVEAERRLYETERARLLEQLVRARRLTDASSVVGSVVHDFANVLAVIGGHAELIAQSLTPTTPLARSVEAIGRGVDQARGLVRRLGVLREGGSAERERVDLNAVVSGQVDLLARSIGTGIAIRRALAPDLPPVLADRVALEQVLANLVMNARDAMPEGGRLDLRTARVEPGAERPPEAPPGLLVRLSVSDTGHGIPEAVLARIFDPFFTTKPPGRGSGLGLPTVRDIVERHGGCLTVHSRVGEGTRFDIYLPAAPPEEPGAQVDDETRIGDGPASDSPVG